MFIKVKKHMELRTFVFVCVLLAPCTYKWYVGGSYYVTFIDSTYYFMLLTFL